MLYAITINPNHATYTTEIAKQVEVLKLIADCSYVEIVNHNNDHYHALIDTPQQIQQLKDLKGFHIERLRNIKAYRKYMHDHDVIETLTFGQLPYVEDDFALIEDLIVLGPIKTVRKWGKQALFKYQALKEFYRDYQNDLRYKNTESDEDI